MKKRHFLIILLASLSFSAFAQSGEERGFHWDIRGGMSVISTFTTYKMQPRNVSYYSTAGFRSLASLYGDYNGEVTATNNFGAEGLIHFGKRSSAGFGLYANHLWCDSFRGVDGKKIGTRKAAALMFVPTYRLYYMSKDMVRLYGSVSLGLIAYFNNSNRSMPADAVFELSPVGVEVGRDWYGFLELGAGSVYVGFSFGAGYRF